MKDRNKKGIDVDKVAEDIVKCFSDYMNEKYDKKINRVQKNDVIRIIREILQAEKGKMIVIPAKMGWGKSVLLKIFIKFMVTQFDEFGSIVVKELIKDVEQFADDIGYVDEDNSKAKLVYDWKGFNPAICLEGYKSYEPLQCYKCSQGECKVKTGKIGQSYHPIVAISHERLFRQSSNQSQLRELKNWEDKYGDKRNRKFLFIDEKPKFFHIISVSSKDVKKFIDDLIKLEKIVGKDLSSSLLTSKIKELFTRIQDGTAQQICDDEVLSILDKINKYWYKNYEGDKPELLNYIKELFSNNYVYKEVSNKETLLKAGCWNDFIFEDYVTVIFDGTAEGDMSYPKDAKLINISNTKQCDNLTIFHCNERNLSKGSFVGNTDDKIESYASEITRIATMGKTLVICSKDYKTKFNKKLKHVQNIKLAHFNSIKGSNEYLDCTNIFFAGTMHFGDSYYILKALGLAPKKIDTLETENKNSKHLFKCEYINEVERNDKESYILQDLFRGAIRNYENTSSVNVYIFNTDDELMKQIERDLQGVKISKWTPLVVLEKIAATQFRLIKKLIDTLKNKDDSINKVKVKAELEISDDQLKKILKNERFKSILREYEIENANRKFIKRGHASI